MKNRELIMAVFEEMMKNNYLENISIGEIMTRCNLPRTTFYRYFKDKYDLMTYIYLHEIEKRIEISMDKNWKNSVRICYEYIYEKRKFFIRILKYEGQNNFLQFLYKYSYQCLASSICAADNIKTLDQRLDYSLKMYCISTAHLVSWWLENGVKISVDELYEIAIDNIPIYLKNHLEDMELVLNYSKNEKGIAKVQ